MFLQVGIQDHVVLVIAEYVRLAVPGNGAQFDSQRSPASIVLVVIHGVVVAAAAVKELPAAGDDAVSEVEPEVGGEVTELTLPPTGRDFRRVLDLFEVLRVFGDDERLPVPGALGGLYSRLLLCGDGSADAGNGQLDPHGQLGVCDLQRLHVGQHHNLQLLVPLHVLVRLEAALHVDGQPRHFLRHSIRLLFGLLARG